MYPRSRLRRVARGRPSHPEPVERNDAWDPPYHLFGSKYGLLVDPIHDQPVDLASRLAQHAEDDLLNAQAEWRVAPRCNYPIVCVTQPTKAFLL